MLTRLGSVSRWCLLLRSERILSETTVWLILLTCLCCFGCAAKKPVLDDFGQIITEEQIRTEMRGIYRGGCCVFGGLGSASVGGFFALSMACTGDFVYGECDDTSFYVIMGVVTVAGIIGSYTIGKNLDEKAAISRIKAERCQQNVLEEGKAQ